MTFPAIMRALFTAALVCVITTGILALMGGWWLAGCVLVITGGCCLAMGTDDP